MISKLDGRILWGSSVCTKTGKKYKILVLNGRCVLRIRVRNKYRHHVSKEANSGR